VGIPWSEEMLLQVAVLWLVGSKEGQLLLEHRDKVWVLLCMDRELQLFF